VTGSPKPDASIPSDVSFDDDDRFRELFSAIDEGYCLCEIIVDDNGKAIDYRFIEANHLFEEMTGLVGAVGRTAYELVPDLEPHWVATYARAALGGERIRFEQGSAAMGRWFDVFTMPVAPAGRFAIVFKDETERRRAALALTESEERYRLLAEQQYRIAVRLQRALLPDHLIQHPNLAITAHYQADSAVLEVGGDWYDTFSWPDGRIGVMVGDVVGHDLEAAAAMGHLRAAVAALAPETDGRPAVMLDALDRCAKGPNGTDFVTACCVVIDPATGKTTYASAGHPPLLIIPPTGHSIWADEASSPPLGTLETSDRRESSFVLEPGSYVILYTDGLIERRSESLDVGLERLRSAAETIVRTDAANIAHDLVVALSGETTLSDDVVVVAVHYMA
jgi:serine phosphatase RsbU (regulator of sigma subunit)